MNDCDFGGICLDITAFDGYVVYTFRDASTGIVLVKDLVDVGTTVVYGGDTNSVLTLLPAFSGL